jgi:hypothetical protein
VSSGILFLLQCVYPAVMHGVCPSGLGGIIFQLQVEFNCPFSLESVGSFARTTITLGRLCFSASMEVASFSASTEVSCFS